MVSTKLTPAEVEARCREVFAAWESLDAQKLADLYQGGTGFGYRSRDPRPPSPSPETFHKNLQLWLDTFDHYALIPETIEADVDGEVGMVWGIYREEFTVKGREPEVVHGRFSEVLRKEPTEPSGWKTLFYHRDATPFDSEGQYLPPPVHRD
jgi:ketosteroid isomerase-like protein